LFRVVLGRTANPDCVNFRVGNHFHGIIGHSRNVELLGSSLQSGSSGEH
jgi:hypothetical protein